MINLFCGFEPAESAGYHVFSHSVITRATAPVSIYPLASMGLPQGSNSFTRSRFLAPALMGYQGHAIFCDASDMLMLDDVGKLDALFDPRYAVQVVKHPDYVTRNHMKYRGTPLECENRNYSRKNWASLMLINCEHPAIRDTWTPERVATASPLSLLQFDGLADSEIGALPGEWNVLIDEGQEGEGAKLLHFTGGSPAFLLHSRGPGTRDWHQEYEAATGQRHG